MIDQPEFDNLADKIVAEGDLVSYASLRNAHKDAYIKGLSNRELQGLYGNWRERRHYRGHLAQLDLPEEMEKAIVTFVKTTMKIAKARAVAIDPVTQELSATAGFLEQMQRIVSGLERQLIVLADENRALKDQVAELLPPPTIPLVEKEPVSARAIAGKRQKKTGAPKLAATVFWDKVISDLSDRIFAEGRPMSADELLNEIPEDTKEFAALAFHSINRSSLIQKLRQRIIGKKFELSEPANERFCVIRTASNDQSTVDEGAPA